MNKLDMDEVRKYSPDPKVWGMAALWNLIASIVNKLRRRR